MTIKSELNARLCGWAAGLALVAMPMLAAAAPVLNAPADVAAITALENADAAAVTGASMGPNYAQHVVVVDYMTHAIYRGRAQVVEKFGAQLAGVKSVAPDIQESSILSDGRFACDALSGSFQVVLKSGQTAALSVRILDALEKINGRWEVVQEQLSAPMDPATGKAVLGSLPVRSPMTWPADILAGPATTSAQGDAEINHWVYVNLRGIGIDAAMAPYGPGDNEEMLYGEIAPGDLRGKAEIRAYYSPVMGSFNAIDLTNPLLRVNSDGLLGAQIDTQDITLHLVKGGVRHIYLRQSDCLHRVNGHWYTVEEMVSFPVALTTGKSVTTP